MSPKATGSSKTEIVVKSGRMRAVLTFVERAMGADVTMLLQGESGTGKELLARFIHEHSQRRDKRFVVVNCGAIPDNLLESELFGYERGAFTGANTRKIGLLELAKGGTFFFDEIGELTEKLQVKLLRAIQEREIRRVGGLETTEIDVRILAATNRDLNEAVSRGSFREDLYYRLQVFPVTVPPLRERSEDILPLATYFFHRSCKEFRKKLLGFSPEAKGLLLEYRWPGNVRELQNAVERAVLMATANRIESPDLGIFLPERSAAGEEPLALSRVVDLACEQHIKAVLQRHKGNKVRAARELEISRSKLYRLLNRYETRA